MFNFWTMFWFLYATCFFFNTVASFMNEEIANSRRDLIIMVFISSLPLLNFVVSLYIIGFIFNDSRFKVWLNSPFRKSK